MATARQDQQTTDTGTARPWLPWVAIIVASALAHLWCLGSQFYMDDTPAIRANPLVLSGRFWQAPADAWSCLGYIVQYRLCGFSPVAYHAVNWLLHTAVACVLFGFGRDFLRGRAAAGVAWFAAMWFVVHPLASEIPNYARTQDLAWVTLFSLLACWALLRFLRDGGRWKLLGCALAVIGASVSKGPGVMHALMMTGAVGLAAATADHWRMLRRHGWLAAVLLIGCGALWLGGILPKLLHASRLWAEPRFIGHAYTLARVFWEFAWRSVIPVALCSDHHIAETLMPPGARFWNIPDTGAIRAAIAMFALTAFSLWLAWRPATRLFGICLFLYIATILFRMLYLIPEFMPEYRIYPGLPWFCLGASIALSALWDRLPGGGSPRFAAALILLPCIVLSARRSFLWHDLDRLTADILHQYPAQARAVWELQDRDIAAGQWQLVIDRQRDVWPQVFARFLEENRRLAPQRELPTGHFTLADVACKGQYALAIAHARSPAAGLAEIRNLELFMRLNHWDQMPHRALFNTSKVLVLEQAGNYQAALAWLHQPDRPHNLSPADIQRIEQKLAAQHTGKL